MEIRSAIPADARRIAEIHVAAWKVAYRGIMPATVLDGLSIDERERRWREQLQGERVHIRVVLDGDSIVGWASFGDCRDADVPEKTGELYGLYLDPAWWRQGLGRELWTSVLCELTDNGHRALTVRVLEANVRARRFYEAMGCRLDPTGWKVLDRAGTTRLEMRYRCDMPAGRPACHDHTNGIRCKGREPYGPKP